MENKARLIDINPIIRNLTDMKSVYDAVDLDAMIKVLEAAPTVSAERNTQWIGVEARLPERYKTVIVRREGGKVEQGCRDVMDWWKVYGTRTKKVTHWMPLPEEDK